MALATVGAVALAFMFAVLSRRIPADGGPYAYARAAFGNGFGFSQAWLYWITAWAGNAAIVVGWVFYVQLFLNKGGSTARLHRHRPGRPLDPGGREPDRCAQHGCLPAVDDGAEVRAVGTDGHGRPPLHQGRQLHALEHERRHQPLRHRWRDGDLPVQLPGRRDRSGRGRQGSQSRSQRPEVHDLRHPRQRRCLPALADRGLRDPAGRRPRPGQQPGVVRRGSQRRSPAAPGSATSSPSP